MEHSGWKFVRHSVLVWACLGLARTCAAGGQERGETAPAARRSAEPREDEPAAPVATSSRAAGDAVEPRPLTRPLLDQSLAAGRQFLLASQLPSGIFRYRVNFLTGEIEPEQNSVRQAGALWGLALIHQDAPSRETREAVLRGLAFFSQHSQCTAAGRRYVRFPGDTHGESGLVALVALALVDFLRAEPPDAHAALRQELDEYLQFLLSLERPDHQFHGQYLLISGAPWGAPSPYADGEILLALVKAARHFQHESCQPVALRAAEACFAAYAQDAIRHRRDDDKTKAHFSWACLAFAELQATQWPGTQPCAQRAIDLAHWMIDVHKTLERPLNTAYAYEGIITACALAQTTGDAASEAQFRHVIEVGLAKLTSWQVGGSQASAFLCRHPNYEASCSGGILSAAEDPVLRIDTAQHQMHAVILARRHVWSAPAPGRVP